MGRRDDNGRLAGKWSGGLVPAIVRNQNEAQRFRADGLDVVDVSSAQDGALATAEAIRGGVGVIFQGTLTGGGPGAPLFGRPDFLVRADLLPAPDGEQRPDGCEVVDAKLARSAKATGSSSRSR